MNCKQQEREIVLSDAETAFFKATTTTEETTIQLPKPTFKLIADNDDSNFENGSPDDNVMFKSWTRDLTNIPTLTQELIQKYFIEDDTSGCSIKGEFKHKSQGYQLFKENYVKKVCVKSNIYKGKQKCFIVKCNVAASMKRTLYDVYIHLCQLTGKILHGKCSCKAGAAGRCKHCAALLYQLCEYIQLGLKSVPDDKTCTDTLQQWHVPGEYDDNNDVILFSDLTFYKADQQKEQNN